jgi:co-chaperonin GroES (HSP10)
LLQIVAVGPGAITREGKVLPMNVKVRHCRRQLQNRRVSPLRPGAAALALAHGVARPPISHAIFQHAFLCPPLLLQVGDKVLLPEYGGHQVKLGEDEFHLYREEDILGKFDLK